MNNHKLVNLLKPLSVSELKEVNKYLNSPFSKGGNLLIKLFVYLKNCHPFIKKGEIEKKYIFKKIWAEEEYNTKRLSKLIGKLYEELENFTSIQCVLNDEMIKRSLLANAKCIQLNRGLFQANAKKWGKELEKERESSQKYYELMRFHELNFEFGQADNYSPKNKDYLAINKYFDLFYYSSKLKISCEGYSQNQMFKLQDVQPQNITDLLLQTQEYSNQRYPLLHIYHEILVFLYSDQNKNAFLQILDLLKEYSAIFQKKELKDLFLTLGKFCTQQRMSGSEIFLGTHLKLYTWALEQNIISNHTSISGANFLNIVFLALAAKEVAYVVAFIKKYRFKISEEGRVDVLLFCLAQYKFTVGEHEKAIYLIEKVSLHLEHYRLRKQYMLIRVYYEYFVQLPNNRRLLTLESKIASCFEFFKKEQKISESRRQRFHNLIWFIRKMKTAHFKGDESIKPQLMEKIKTKDVVFKAWLINKIKELP